MNKCYLFNFQGFLSDLRENKPEIVEDYEKNYGGLEGKDCQDLPFYKDYLSKFQVADELKEKLQVPEELRDDFDYFLLLLLVMGSFSSEYYFDYRDVTDLVRLKIMVKNGDQEIAKDLDGLWSFQIQRLFEIYVEEQMNLENLMAQSEQEKRAINKEREMRLKRFNIKQDALLEEIAYAPKRLELRNKFLELIGEPDC